MNDNIESLHVPFSMKNIGIPSRQKYLKMLIYRIEDFIRRLRWHCFFIGPPTFNIINYKNENQKQQQNSTTKPDENDDNETFDNFEFEDKQWYGFKSEKTPPVIKELVEFEDDLYKLARNINFRKINNEFQREMNETLKAIKSAKEIIVPADKSQCLYKIPIQTYKKLLTNETTKKYKKSNNQNVVDVNIECRNLVEENEPGLESRVEIFTEEEAFITVKDHKPNFPSKIEVRLINPAKPQIGRITKIKIQEINNTIRSKTKLNQLQSTNDAISWFDSLKLKENRLFLSFDIVSFYPNISEKVLKKVISWAKTITKISKKDEEMILMARKSFLFIDGHPWVKKDNPSFDVTMGAYDGAEVAEFVGLYILNRLSTIMSISDFALYRDDGICATFGTKRSVEKLRQNIAKILADIGFQIETPTGPVKSVDFLDLNFNLDTGCYSPYRKPLSKPIFIHCDSNHPNVIKKEIPKMVANRISNNSSNEKIFENAKKPYIQALKNSGHKDFEFKFQNKEKPNITKPKLQPKKNTNNTKNTRLDPKQKPKKKKVKKRKNLYFNPPWNIAVKTKVGKEFLALIDKFKGKPQSKYINRHVIRLSYSTMPNLKSHIKASNMRKLKPIKDQIEDLECTCIIENTTCPVNGECKVKNVIYEAKLKSRNHLKIYT